MTRLVTLLLAATALAALSAAPGQDKADKEKVAMLLKELRQGEPKAAYLLGQMGPAAKDAIPTLVEMLLREPRPGDSLADNSAIALGKIGPDAVPALIRVLQDRKATVAWPHAASAVKAIGPPAREAVPALVDVAKAPNKDVLTPCLAVDALGAIGPAAKDAVPALIDLLKHNSVKHPNGRTHLVVALGKIGPDAAEATKTLHEVRERADALLRLHIDEALEKIGKK
jgi:hypothetical protein